MVIKFHNMWPRAATQNMCLSLMVLNYEYGVFDCVQLDQCFIHNVLDVITNHANFKVNRITTLIFQLKLFNTSVTLKYKQGH